MLRTRTGHVLGRNVARGLARRTIVSAPPPIRVDPSTLPEEREKHMIQGSTRHLLTSAMLNVMMYNSKTSNAIRASNAVLFDIFRHCRPELGWFEWMGVPETFLNKHLLLSTHVWMVNRVLLNDNSPDAKRLQTELYTQFWTDTTKRIRQAGVSEMLVNKNLEKIQQITFENAAYYDVGYLAYKGEAFERDADVTLSEKGDDTDLGSAIWRGLFNQNEDVPDERISQFVEYVLVTIERFERIPIDKFVESAFEWNQYPDDFVVPPPLEVPTDGSMRSEWHEYYDDVGRRYKWHLRTRESEWIDPK